MILHKLARTIKFFDGTFLLYDLLFFTFFHIYSLVAIGKKRKEGKQQYNANAVISGCVLPSEYFISFSCFAFAVTIADLFF